MNSKNRFQGYIYEELYIMSSVSTRHLTKTLQIPVLKKEKQKTKGMIDYGQDSYK